MENPPIVRQVYPWVVINQSDYLIVRDSEHRWHDIWTHSYGEVQV